MLLCTCKWLSKLGLISYQPKTQMYTSNHSVKNIRVLAPLIPRGLARTHVACSYKAMQTGWAKSDDLYRERSWRFSPLILLLSTTTYYRTGWECWGSTDLMSCHCMIFAPPQLQFWKFLVSLAVWSYCFLSLSGYCNLWCKVPGTAVKTQNHGHYIAWVGRAMFSMFFLLLLLFSNVGYSFLQNGGNYGGMGKLQPSWRVISSSFYSNPKTTSFKERNSIHWEWGYNSLELTHLA